MRDRAELVATILLAVAAVATAWSGYQATRWNGEQAKASGRTNAIRIEAARAQGLRRRRRRSTWRRSSSGSTPIPRRIRRSRTSTSDASAPSSRRPSWPGSRRSRSRIRTRHSPRSRCRSTSSPRPRRPSAWMPTPRCLRRRSGETSSARRTTCSGSCSSRSRSSSRVRAEAQGSTATRSCPRSRLRRLPRDTGLDRHVPRQPLGLTG